MFIYAPRMGTSYMFIYATYMGMSYMFIHESGHFSYMKCATFIYENGHFHTCSYVCYIRPWHICSYMFIYVLYMGISYMIFPYMFIYGNVLYVHIFPYMKVAIFHI